jgi:glycosyltransferase involved in cell wall biosynthesis
MSRRVLLVCYYFPPLGLGGVGRPLNLIKRLPQHGWECHVLTVKPVLYRAYEPELLEGLDMSRIFRAGSYDPQRFLYLLGVRKVKAQTISQARPVAEKFFPDSKVGWVGPAVRLGRRLQEQHDYAAVISTSPPISAHLIAFRLGRELDLPWIADFRDFWTIYKSEEIYADENHRARARQMLHRIRDKADALTAVNRSIVEYLGAGEVIPNGYDPETAEYWKQAPSTDAFTIGLLGHQHDTREIEPLLKLLERFRDRRPDGLKSLRLLQVGEIDAQWFRSLMAERGLDLQIDLRGRQSRAETIRTLSQAHLFFLGISQKEGPGFLPGRTFELIASGRPVLAYCRAESEVAYVVGQSSNGVCYHDDSPDRAVEELITQHDLYVAGSYQFAPLSDYARQFSGDELARRFAELLDRLT